jgi:hypothetical protein
LFRRAGAAALPPRGDQVVASSYGSVYGVLFDDARRLYIVDGVGLKEHMYELDGTAAGRETSVKPADRQRGQRAIKNTIDEIARFYGFNAPAP